MQHEKQKDEINYFAVTNYHNRNIKFGIKLDDRRRHVYIVGKTGMGKTNLLENMIYNDIMNGKGCCYVDPHGDTAEKILSFIPSNRINDVIYFNPADMEFPIAFNVLEQVAPDKRSVVSDGLVTVFKKLWADSWGPRLEYILRYCILALLEYPGSTLLGINRMLTDKIYRGKVIEKVTDPVVRAFWVDEFSKWSDKVLQEVISPIQNKVGQFLSTSLIRNIVGQVISSVDLRKIMDDKKILILNLSKGRIGEVGSKLLGSMLVTKISIAAMSRVDIPETERNDFYLYVDEFQNFATDAFADILSEARKYRLNLTIAHQYIEQLGEVVKPAVFGNVGTMVVFRIGAADAEELEKEFEPAITMQDLVNLPKYNIYLKLMIDGVTSDPFSATCLPPLSQRTYNEAKVIQSSRERYAVPREVVEDKIRRWSESKPDEEAPRREAPYPRREAPAGPRTDRPPRRDEKPARAAEPVRTQQPPRIAPAPHKPKSEKPKGEQFEAKCDSCGATTMLSFKPDGTRPIYCKDCLKKARDGKLPMTLAKPKGVPANEFTGKIRIVKEEQKSEQVNERSSEQVKKEREGSEQIIKKQPIGSHDSITRSLDHSITPPTPKQSVNLLEELPAEKPATPPSGTVKPGQVIKL